MNGFYLTTAEDVEKSSQHALKPLQVFKHFERLERLERFKCALILNIEPRERLKRCSFGLNE
jgi:hypothetical protein